MDKEYSKQFVESLLNEEIVDFSVAPGSNSGDNIASEIIAFKVLTKKGETIHMVHKILPMSEQRRFAIQNQIFKTEITFYSSLIPKLEPLVNKRLEDANLAKYQLPVPKFIAGFSDNENDHVTLEDMRPRGYKMVDKYIGFNAEQVAMILTALAKFHAYTYFLIKYEGERIFDESQDFHIFNKNLFLKEDMREFGAAMVRKCYENAIQLVKKPDFCERTGCWIMDELLLKFIQPSEAFNIVTETPLRTDGDIFPVIVHGDLWVNNILIRHDHEDPQKPKSVKFIDFQHMRRGNIFEELLYFTYTSTTIEFRRKHLTASLNLYYNEFTNALKEIKCPLPLNFSRDNFIDGFNRGMRPTLLYMGFAIPMQLNLHSNEDDSNSDNDHNDTDVSDDEKVNGEKMANKLWMHLQESPVGVKRIEELIKEMVLDRIIY